MHILRYKKLPLVSQMNIVIISLMTVILLWVVSFTYIRSSRDIIRQHFADRQMLLDLQSVNMEAYLSQLDSYSLHLRTDHRFMELITSSKPLNYFSTDYLQNLVRNDFYARDDIVDFRLYDAVHNTSYTISRTVRNVKRSDASAIYLEPKYMIFSQGRYYKACMPSEKKDEMLIFFRTIINIQDRKPIAFVRFTVDRSWPELNIGTTGKGDISVLAGPDGAVFYERGAQGEEVNELKGLIRRNADTAIKTPVFVKLGHKSYMPVISTGVKSGWHIISLVPKKQIDAYTETTRNIGFLMGFLSIVISAFVISFFIRFFTRPLSALAEQLRSAGRNGNFKAALDIGGSSEIISLSGEFNSMMKRIDDLIEKNYMAELAWKNAQLVALKAQINPHFLYNTLQTISAEAIENDQMKINDMVMALSSMLKYTIHGQDTVTLQTEMEHVNDYLFLQKQRFGERLAYTSEIADDLKLLMIPKISIMSLTENSIIHGMSKSADTLHIQITARNEDGRLIITVTDDGDGIPEDRLAEIQASLDSPDRTVTGESIGLKNLSNRLKLIYGESAHITVYSTQFTGTSTVMVLNADTEKSNV